jgi:3-oxoacyl-[acyl-carrier-protein] synthase-3
LIQKNGIKFLGTGSYKPDFVVTNSDFSKHIETDDEWITTRTGIKQRRMNIGNTNFFMAVKAAKRALDSAGVAAGEIDMIIAATATPDFFYPSMSCLVQHDLGAVNAFAIDINSACTGFVNALDVARNYLAVGACKKVLVVASEMLSNQIDFTDRGTCVLFGDGAGAAVVESSDKQYSAFLRAKGENSENISLKCSANYAGNSPFVHNDGGICTSPYLQMDGKEVYKFASDIMPKAVVEVCDRAGWELSDIDLLIPHQANIRIIKAAMKNLNVHSDRVYVNIHDTGNISSACIPVCLDELYSAGRIKPGMRVCLVAFGAGLTYGAIALEI